LSNHGDLSKFNDFLGLGVGEITMNTLRNKNLKILNVPGFPINKDTETSYKPFREFLAVHATECNVIFQQSNDNWAFHYNINKWIMVHKFRESMKRNALPKLIWNNNKINVVIHIRTQNFTTHPLEYYKQVLIYLLDWIKGLSIAVHIFTDSGLPEMENAFTGLPYSTVTITIYTKQQLSDVSTFYHITEADVFIMSRSGFSIMPAHFSVKPLIFSPNSIVMEDHPLGAIVMNVGTRLPVNITYAEQLLTRFIDFFTSKQKT